MSVMKSVLRRWSGWATAVLALGFSGMALAEPQTVVKESAQSSVVVKESAQPAVVAKKVAKESAQPAQAVSQAVSPAAKTATVAAKAATQSTTTQSVVGANVTAKAPVQPAVVAKKVVKESAQSSGAVKESSQPAVVAKKVVKESAQPAKAGSQAVSPAAKTATVAAKAATQSTTTQSVARANVTAKASAQPAVVAKKVPKESTQSAKAVSKTVSPAAKTPNRATQASARGAATSQQVRQQVKPQSKQLAQSQASGHQAQDDVSAVSSGGQAPAKKAAVTQSTASQSSKSKASRELGSLENPIKVGVLQLSPFVIERQGRYSGLVVAYWEKIASRHGWHYQFVNAGKNYAKAIEATAQGRYDLVLGNFSTTYERSKLVDFSRPFLLNYASVLTEPQTRNVFWMILKVVKMILPVLCFLFVALCCITLVFVFTRDLTEERGLLANAFCAVMTLMRMGGYVQKPSALLSRVVVMILAFFSVFFMATFSAVMTDVILLLEQPKDPFMVLSDLKGKTFVVAQGSSFVDVVRGYDANVVEIPDAEYAGRYYFANRAKYDGFVGDQALVHELARQLSSRDIMQSAINLRNDELVFLYNKRFPYQSEVDEGILRLQDRNVSMLICAHYLGVDSKLCVL